ncbi:hypothetical protein [Sanguibacter suaedae]|uniref:LppX_LprAFG lipoprotein n=1 Tax=Sanguibacter suaedae TaxID=2795737 RepID=A0A934IEY8_9MICO|nr:hypothetical protein [Sanguibacter suaedae]MBI9115704.1 hypothetical protein [Sanguibacter suaedae]
MRAGGALAALTTLLLLAACTPEPVDGQAFPDWDHADALASERFDAQLAALDAAIDASDPFRSDAQPSITGVSYVHATYGDRDSGQQSVVSLHGNPASVLIQQTDADPGFTVDTLHVSGEDVDYLLLGDGYSSLAPTPWVEVPTVYGHPGEDPLVAGLRSMCFVDGFQTMCEIRDAITYTADSAVGGDARRSVDVEPDGTVFTRTEVTLAAVLVDNSLVHLPQDIVDELSPTMLDTFIPVALWQDPDGNLVKMEMNGTVPGTDGAEDLAVQVGFEVTGAADPGAFPDLPATDDVTVIPARGTEDFYDRMGDL